MTKPSLSHVKLRLTLAEAEALSHAVGNSLYSMEDAMGILHDKKSVNAAYKAAKKLDEAILEHVRHKEARHRKETA